VLLQAQARGAAFVVAPCCVGKLKDGGMKSVGRLKSALAFSAPEGSTEEVTGMPADGGDAIAGGVDADALVVRSGGGRAPLRVIHPRSQWGLACSSFEPPV